MSANQANSNMSLMLARGVPAAAAFPPSVLAEVECGLYGPYDTDASFSQANAGSLFEGLARPRLGEFSLLGMTLGERALSRIVGFTPGLPDAMSSGRVTYVGGVCAASTRESTMAGRMGAGEDGRPNYSLGEDPLTGGTYSLRDPDGPGLSDVVTLTQIIETIGVYPPGGRGVIVVEDLLWADRLIAKTGIPEDSAGAEQIREAVRLRNARTHAAALNLRRVLFTDPGELLVVPDATVIEELRSEVDDLFARLGLERDERDQYSLTWGGMYAYPWEKILKTRGYISGDDTIAIFEPHKHFIPEPSQVEVVNDRTVLTNPVTNFRRRLLEVAPYLVAGSDNEQIGLMPYLEPRDANGRLFRRSIPTALQPNNVNYRGFDYSRFPVVPKSAQGLPKIEDFTFVDNIGSSPGNNPAFLWGLVCPQTEITAALMQDMISIATSYRTQAKNYSAMLSRDATPSQKAELASQLRAQANQEMTFLATKLIEELQYITNRVFEGTYETQ